MKKETPAEGLMHIAERLRPFARQVSKLKHDPANARKHGPKNSAAIRASLSEHGQVKPIVILKDGTVIAGNGTLDAAVNLGWSHLAVVEFAGDEQAARRFAIQDNRTAELAEWDDVELSRLLAEMRGEEEDSLRSLGFLDMDLEKLIAKPRISDSEFKSVSIDVECDYRCPSCSYEWKGTPK